MDDDILEVSDVVAGRKDGKIIFQTTDSSGNIFNYKLKIKHGSPYEDGIRLILEFVGLEGEE